MSQKIVITQSSLNKLSGLVIGLEGSIGVGKTTFGNGLKNYADSNGVPCSLFLETAHQACLKYFIDDPEEYGPVFQVYMLSDCQNRVQQAMREARRGELCVVDRTPLGNTIFEEVGHRLKGSISAKQHAFYESVRDRIPLFGVNYVLFFDLDPQECLDRMDVRGNSEELKYKLEYFNQLDTMYFHRILDTIFHERCPVVVVPPLRLNLQTQIIHVLEQVHTLQWKLPKVSLQSGSLQDTLVIGKKTVGVVDELEILMTIYKDQSNHVPDPYLGKDPISDKNGGRYFNYTLFAQAPNEFKRCVMWTLASMRDVVIYNYAPEDSLQTDETSV